MNRVNEQFKEMYRGFKVVYCYGYYRISDSITALRSIKAVHNVIDTYIKRTGVVDGINDLPDSVGGGYEKSN